MNPALRSLIQPARTYLANWRGFRVSCLIR